MREYKQMMHKLSNYLATVREAEGDIQHHDHTVASSLLVHSDPTDKYCGAQNLSAWILGEG